jgi:hypothetical protein
VAQGQSKEKETIQKMHFKLQISPTADYSMAEAARTKSMWLEWSFHFSPKMKTQKMTNFNTAVHTEDTN